MFTLRRLAALTLMLGLAACNGGGRSAPTLLPQSQANKSAQFEKRFSGFTAPSLGTAFAVLSTDPDAQVHLESGASISGNVGIVGVKADLQVDQNATIAGTVHVLGRTHVQNEGTITGAVTADPLGLILATANAVAVSEYDASLVPTIPSPSTIDLSPNQSLTITGSSTPGTVNVLKLSALQMAQTSTLTFDAPAGSTFVVNVAGEAHLQQFARVLVSGGISAGDVVFNFTGFQGDVHLEQGATWNASILALGRQNEVLAPNSIVGGVIVAAGENLLLEQGAKVRGTLLPPSPAPSPTPSPTPTPVPVVNIVQNAVACTGPVGSECALGSGPANGDLILIWGTFSSPNCSATDSNGKALTAYYVSPSSGIGSYTCIFHYTVTGSPSNVYHITPLSASPYNAYSGIMELANTVPADAVSTTLSWTASNGSTPAISSLAAGGFSLCYNQPNGFGAASDITINGVAVSGFTNGTGFYSSATGAGLGGYYLNAAPLSNYSCSFTNSTNAGNLNQAILLSYSHGAGPVQTPTPVPTPTTTPVRSIGIVQSPAACTGPAGAECALPSNPANGDLVLIWGTFGSPSCTATDSNGNALAAYYVSPSSYLGSYTCIFHYTVAGSPSNTYHITPLAGSGYNALAGIIELSNTVPANATSTTLSWSAASGSTPNIASLAAGGFSLCYNQPNGFAAASDITINGVSVSGFTNGTGFYSSSFGGGAGLGGYYLNNAAISNYNCSFTNSTNANNLNQAILLSYSVGP